MQGQISSPEHVFEVPSAQIPSHFRFPEQVIRGAILVSRLAPVKIRRAEEVVVVGEDEVVVVGEDAAVEGEGEGVWAASRWVAGHAAADDGLHVLVQGAWDDLDHSVFDERTDGFVNGWCLATARRP